MRNLEILARFSARLSTHLKEGTYVTNVCFDEFANKLAIYTSGHVLMVFKMGLEGAPLDQLSLESSHGMFDESPSLETSHLV